MSAILTPSNQPSRNLLFVMDGMLDACLRSYQEIEETFAMSFFRMVAVISIMLTGVPLAQAAVLYSETFTPNTGTFSDIDSSFRVANDFSTTADGTITSVVWKGMYYASGTPQAIDDFDIVFYSDAGGSVGAQLASFSVGNSVSRTATGDFFGGVEFFAYEASLGVGLDVLSSSSYWISIVNDTTVDADDGWFWATNISMTSPGANAFLSRDSGSSFQEYNDWPYYFVLSGSEGAGNVPVPATIILMGLGLFGIGYQRRSRAKG